jgi:hypothetical protein
MNNIKKIALVESIVNVGTGLILSALIFQPIIFYVYNINLDIRDGFVIAIYFTLISVLRGYIWRLFFHKRFYENSKK